MEPLVIIFFNFNMKLYIHLYQNRKLIPEFFFLLFVISVWEWLEQVFYERFFKCFQIHRKVTKKKLDRIILNHSNHILTFFETDHIAMKLKFPWYLSARRYSPQR